MKQKFKMPEGEIEEKEFPIFKTPHNHDTNFESDRTALYCAEQSLTKQEFKEEVDINNIINRFLKTGEPPPMPIPEHFTDVTGKQTYLEMHEKIAIANANFYRQPAALRAEFQNSPELWADAVLEAVNNRNATKLEHLGMTLDKKAPPDPPATPTPPGGTPAPGLENAPPSGAKKAPSGAKD